MVKYTCLYYGLIQSGLEFSGERRGGALGVGKFSTLSYQGHSAGELGLHYSQTRHAPLPRPSLGRIGGRGRGAPGRAGPAPAGTPGSGPPGSAGQGRAGKGRDGMERERKATEGAGGDDLPVPGLLAGASVRNSISIFYEK